MEFKKEEIIVIALAVILFLGFIFLVKPSTTGYILYTPASNEYNYNSSLVNFSNNEIKLIPTITTTTTEITTESITQISSATIEGEDKSSQVNSLENQDVLVPENKNLSIILSNNLQNKDIISIYFKHNKVTDVNLCHISIGCSKVYSTQTYNSNPSFINFTISNSDQEFNSFILVPLPENIKVDYIYATHIKTTTNNTTTIIYPSSGTIESNDIEPINISRFDYINYSHILNNQNIEYYYSADSGSNWINITSQNISSLNLTKIKIRAKLFSDSTSTPTINSLSLFYIEKETQIQQNQTNNNSNKTTFIREVLDNELTYIKIYSETNLSQETITISSSNLTHPNKNKLKTVEINTNINFNSAILRINYTNNELGNINESTLKLNYYNDTSGNWEEINFVLNINENYIESNLTHFSVYGIFGDSNQNDGSNTGSGGSGIPSVSNSGTVDRAPSSKVSNSKDKIIQNQPQKQKQEPKEIKLFEEPQTEEKQEKTGLIIPTAQVIKEVKKPNYLGVYLFVALVVILYFIYHHKVKRSNSIVEKILEKIKIKKLKKRK